MTRYLITRLSLSHTKTTNPLDAETEPFTKGILCSKTLEKAKSEPRPRKSRRSSDRAATLERSAPTLDRALDRAPEGMAKVAARSHRSYDSRPHTAATAEFHPSPRDPTKPTKPKQRKSITISPTYLDDAPKLLGRERREKRLHGVKSESIRLKTSLKRPALPRSSSSGSLQPRSVKKSHHRFDFADLSEALLLCAFYRPTSADITCA